LASILRGEDMDHRRMPIKRGEVPGALFLSRVPCHYGNEG
jgi:hypothetical protein